MRKREKLNIQFCSIKDRRAKIRNQFVVEDGGKLLSDEAQQLMKFRVVVGVVV